MKSSSVPLSFMLLGIAFCACLIASNLLETKIIQLGPVTITAGFLVFPISYIINDCIAEVWGFRRARLLIWLGFAVNFTMLALFQLAVALPSALASGVMRAFTLPLEYASYLYESALLVQKLLYLYTGIKEEHMLAHHQLPGYLCIFFGTAFTAKGVSAVSGTLMRMALRHALKMRMSSFVPLAGGAVNAAVTRLSMKQLAEELIAQLKERRIEHQEYLTIGCAPGKVETPLFHLNAEDVAR